MSGNITFATAQNKIDRSLISMHNINDITYETVEKKIDILRQFLISHDQRYVCIVHGEGSQPRKVYQELQKLNDIKVIWYRSMLSPLWKIFQFFIASYEGLVLVHEVARLNKVFQTLSYQAMASIYIIQKKNMKTLLEMIEKSDSDFQNKLLTLDTETLIYTVDTDNFESTTGIVEIIIVGKDGLFKKSDLNTN